MNNPKKIEFIRQVHVKSPYDFKIVEKPFKGLGKDEVLMRIRACGLCGTDNYIAKNGASDWMPLGHEIAGEVIDVGESVERFKPGDKVVAENHTMCGVCSSCKNGLPVYCENMRIYYEIEAGLADYIVLHHTMFNKYDGISYEDASMAEPLTVALDLVQMSDIPLNSDVAVFGTGAISMLAIQCAKLKGARSVILMGSGTDKKRSQFKKDIGEKIGADFYIDFNDPDFDKKMNDRYPDGVDRILITSPPKTFLKAIDIAKIGGIIGLVGIVYDEGRNVTFDMNAFHFKRLQLRCPNCLPNLMFPMALDMLKTGLIKTKEIITHQFKFEDYLKGFDLLRDPNQQVVKIIITD
jgi:threonine dehydrogenase-like Zn-dependent dehydrogenase